jgi:hypothetical protein
MLHWYKHEPTWRRWEEDDFLLGIHKVIQYYPDHRHRIGNDTERQVYQAKDIKAFIKHEAAAYLKTQKMTPPERKDLLEWVKDGNSVHNNPWLLYSEEGHPLDFLDAMRITEDL